MNETVPTSAIACRFVRDVRDFPKGSRAYVATPPSGGSSNRVELLVRNRSGVVVRFWTRLEYVTGFVAEAVERCAKVQGEDIRTFADAETSARALQARHDHIVATSSSAERRAVPKA